MSTLNLEFQPIVANRNYAPTRTFITKWDVEIDNNRAKKIARTRDRDTKYFDDFEYVQCAPLVLVQPQIQTQKPIQDEDDDDGDDEETHQGWLQSVRAENAYYDRKYGRSFNVDWYDMNEVELDTDQGNCKRPFFSGEESDFKRVRA
jgi:hypothetical protein